MERSHEDAFAKQYPITTSRFGFTGLGLTAIYAVSSYLLQANLNFPEILLEKAPIAMQVFNQSSAANLLGFLGLFASAYCLWIFSAGFARHDPNAASQQIHRAGAAAALIWMVSLLAWLLLSLFWTRGMLEEVYPVVSALVLILYGIIVPLLLSLWTWRIDSIHRSYRALAVLGVLGLLATAFRSAVWVLNGWLPVEQGYYGAAGILSVLAVAGKALWLLWIFLVSFPYWKANARKAGEIHGLRPVLEPAGREQSQPIQRGERKHPWATRLILFLAAMIFTLAYCIGMVLAFPTFPSNQALAEPSVAGSLLYGFIWVYEGLLHPAHSVAEMRAQSFGSSRPLPGDIHLEGVSALGVPAQFVCAPGATKDHIILYLHGGGFAEQVNDQHYIYAATLSRMTGGCVLLPKYRLAPEQPFPAGLQDCIQAYRWLIAQHIPPAHIVIMGESAGGTLVLTTALDLRDAHFPLPAGLIALSPATDLSMAGITYRTKASVDPILNSSLAQDAFRDYTAGRPRAYANPLISPVFADVNGLPPTFLLAGTQEVLLSDAQRMAERMKSSGMSVKLEIGPGMWHTWPLVGNFLPDAKLANQHIAEFIQQQWGK